MHMNERRLFRLFPLVVAVGFIQVGASLARADFGWGFGIGSFNYVAQPSDVVNQHAMIRAANAPGGPVSRPVYGNNSNAYINRVRDPGFTGSYGIETRRSLAQLPYQQPRSSQVPSTPAARARPEPKAPEAPKAVLPIASFFNASKKLLWPNDAPDAGDLASKRYVSDEATLVVYNLVEKHGSAPITTVTHARQLLLDYGRPALQYIRGNSTPRVSETFHYFLLSLYESLAQAANPPEVKADGK